MRPPASTSDAVAQLDQLVGVRARDDDREAVAGRAAHVAVDLAARADVDALRRLVEQQQPGGARQPAGEHDLLLVAAREQRHLPAGPRAAHGEAVDGVLARPALLAEPQPARQPEDAAARFFDSELAEKFSRTSSRRNAPSCARSSGTYPTPAPTAAAVSPGGSRRPATSTSPCGRGSAPKSALSRLDRPEPTRPARPTTSPGRDRQVDARERAGVEVADHQHGTAAPAGAAPGALAPSAASCRPAIRLASSA